jgi:hypothetical protein
MNTRIVPINAHKSLSVIMISVSLLHRSCNVGVILKYSNVGVILKYTAENRTSDPSNQLQPQH